MALILSVCAPSAMALPQNLCVNIPKTSNSIFTGRDNNVQIRLRADVYYWGGGGKAQWRKLKSIYEESYTVFSIDGDSGCFNLSSFVDQFRDKNLPYQSPSETPSSRFQNIRLDVKWGADCPALSGMVYRNTYTFENTDNFSIRKRSSNLIDPWACNKTEA